VIICSATDFTITSIISSVALINIGIIIISKNNFIINNQNNIRNEIIKDFVNLTNFFESSFGIFNKILFVNYSTRNFFIF
jgi:hypothetical protein